MTTEQQLTDEVIESIVTESTDSELSDMEILTTDLLSKINYLKATDEKLYKLAYELKEFDRNEGKIDFEVDSDIALGTLPYLEYLIQELSKVSDNLHTTTNVLQKYLSVKGLK